MKRVSMGHKALTVALAWILVVSFGAPVAWGVGERDAADNAETSEGVKPSLPEGTSDTKPPAMGDDADLEGSAGGDQTPGSSDSSDLDGSSGSSTATVPDDPSSDSAKEKADAADDALNALPRLLSSGSLGRSGADSSGDPAPANVSAVFADGDGSEANPYKIVDVAQFKAFRDSVNAGETYEGKHIQLTASTYDLAGEEWTPIGTGARSGSGYADGKPFKGTFDGNGATISGLSLTQTTSADYALGLFGLVDGATVKSFTLEDLSISVPTSELAGAAVGLMVGGSTVSGITAKGTVQAKRGNGGIVGRLIASGTIEGCANYATVTATAANCGGIVGAAYYTVPGGEMHIQNCTNEGAVTSQAGVAGGIVGLSAAQVSGCRNVAPVSAKGDSVGGIVGEQQNYGSVTRCVNEADVTNGGGTFGTGGIVGWIRYSGSDANYQRKGVVTVSDNENSGSVTSSGASAGGIVGHVYNAADVRHNQNHAPLVKSTNFVAGIVGSLQRAAANDFEQAPAILVEDNVSSTSFDQIQGGCRDLYAYNNEAATFVVRGNAPTWLFRLQGSALHASLPVAVAQAGAGDGIELLADADLFAGKDQMDAVKIDKDLTLDLAGHTLKARLQVTNGTTTLVGDGTLESIDARLTATFVATALTVDAGAAAVVDGLTVKSKAAGLYAYGTLDVKRAVVQTTEWAICANDSCNVTLGEPGAPDDDVVVTSERGNCLSTAAATGNAAAKVTINSGTYETGAAAVEWNAGPVYWASHGTLAVSGGQFSGSGSTAAIVQKNGTVNVSGGTFQAKDGLKVVAQQDSTEIVTNVTGGAFSGTRAGLYLDASNGSFMAALQNYQVALASGDGTTPVFKGDAEGGLYLKTAGLGDKTLMVVSGGLYQETPDQAAIDLAPYCAADYAAYQKENGSGMYEVRHAEYALAYDLAGGAWPEGANPNPLKFTSESAPITLMAPERAGYTFAGWTGGGLAQPTKDVTIPLGSQGDRDYTATWTADAARIVFVSNGGSQVVALEGVTDGPITGALPSPTRSGYDFAGWFDNSGLTGTALSALPATFPVGTTTYYAKWVKKAAEGNVTILVELPGSAGDDVVATVTDQAANTALATVKNMLAALKAGEVPLGMSKADAERLQAALADPQDEVVVAISFGITRIDDVVSADEQAAIEGQKASHEEILSYFDLSLSMTVTVIDKDSGEPTTLTVDLSAVDEPLLYELRVAPEALAGKSVRIAHVHEDVPELILPVSVDRKEGLVKFHAQRFSTYALLASSQVTVTFDANGGALAKASDASQTVPFGDRVSQPADPIWSGHVFAGWFADQNLTQPFDFSKGVETSLTLYAKWTDQEVPSTPPTSATQGKKPTEKHPLGMLTKTGDETGLLVQTAFALAAFAALSACAAIVHRRRKSGR